KLNIAAKQGFIPGGSPIDNAGTGVNITFAYATSDTTATAQVDDATLSIGGDLAVTAHSRRNLQSLAAAGAYEDGVAGVGISILTDTTNVTARLGGTATVG